MLSSILIATDGSEASDRVIDCLGGLRRIGVQRSVLAHVFDVRHVGGLHEALKAKMAPHLERQRSVLVAAGFDVTIETPLGIPFYEINRLAQGAAASLIVIGSLGGSLVGETLLGSTAHALLHHADRPVLLIRLAITDGGNGAGRCRVVCSDLFGQVLFPTDFSDTADRAFLFLEHIVREVAPSVSLLHVQDRTKLERHLAHRLEEFNRIDQDRLDRMRERLRALGAPSVTTEVAYGIPAQVILERARQVGPTLIVMGGHGRGAFHEAVLGGVASRLARLAPLPILFVPRVEAA